MKIRVLTIAAAVLLAAQPAGAQDKIELKASTFVPPTHWFFSEILTQWAAEMAKRTGGNVTVRLFAGNSPFGNVVNQADQVAAGVTDAAIGLNGVPRGRVPRTLIGAIARQAPPRVSPGRLILYTKLIGEIRWALLKGYFQIPP